MLYVLKNEAGKVIAKQVITNEAQIAPFERAGFVLAEDQKKPDKTDPPAE